MRLRRISSVLLALATLSFSIPSRAGDDFKDSPVAFGDNNHVEVHYDQRVTNQVQHKHFVIYQGESAAQIKELLTEVLAQDDSIRADLQAKKEQEAFEKIHAALEARMTEAQISLDGLSSQLNVISGKLDKVEETGEKTEAHVERLDEELTYPWMLVAVALGWVGDASAGRWSNGVIGRLDFDFVVGDTESHARHNVIISATFDGTESDQIFLSPSGVELDRGTASSSYRCGGDIGYGLALGPSWQFIPYFAIGGGAQWFASAVTKGASATGGLRTGVETRFGSFRNGFRMGAEYSLMTVREPTYSFRGLSVVSSPDRESVSGVRIYLGGYWGLL